jgi:hypothetical protein
MADCGHVIVAMARSPESTPTRSAEEAHVEEEAEDASKENYPQRARPA